MVFIGSVGEGEAGKMSGTEQLSGDEVRGRFQEVKFLKKSIVNNTMKCRQAHWNLLTRLCKGGGY